MVAHHIARCGKAGLQAQSISRRVWAQLQGGTLRAQALAVFERACNLMTADGDVLALVLPQIGDGPLNIVVDGAPSDLALLKPGDPAQLTQDCLEVGNVSISLASTSVWEPCPDWDSLRACHKAITQQIPHLQATALHYGPGGSLLALLPDPLAPDPAGLWSSSCSAKGTHELAASEPPREGQADAMLASAQVGAEALRKGWAGDAEELRSGASKLSGLGGGLTPAGDDFLTGVMFSAWLAHPAPRQLCRTILEASVPRTTVLSAAFLSVAVEGECSTAWHQLLDALAGRKEDQLMSAVGSVLSHGHTSGADTLAGFLWMAAMRWAELE